MPLRSSNHIPFAERTRTARKRACHNALNNVRRSTTVLGGKFYGHHALHGENGWIDGCFLRRHKPMFYNFCLQTTRCAYKEKVVDISWDRSYVVAPLETDLSIFDLTVKNPTSGLYVTPARQPHHDPELDGMTRLEWTQAQSAMMGTVPLSYSYDPIEHWGIEPYSIAHPWDWGPDFDASVGPLIENNPTLPRGPEVIEKAVQHGDGIPPDEVIAKIEARFEAARAQNWPEA